MNVLNLFALLMLSLLTAVCPTTFRQARRLRRDGHRARAARVFLMLVGVAGSTICVAVAGNVPTLVLAWFAAATLTLSAARSVETVRATAGQTAAG